jgi:zinc resistance-associated protein
MDVIAARAGTAKSGTDFLRVMRGPKWRIAMKPTLLASAFTLATLLGSGAALAAPPSSTESANAPPAAEHFVLTPADRQALLDAKIAAIHAGLKLTPDQEKQWPAVEAAIRKAGNDAIERFQKFKQEPATENFIDRLRQRGENAVARGQDMEAIAKAAEPLYASLNEDQKHRLPVLMHMLRPHFHHRFAMMGEHGGQWGR